MHNKLKGSQQQSFVCRFITNMRIVKAVFKFFLMNIPRRGSDARFFLNFWDELQRQGQTFINLLVQFSFSDSYKQTELKKKVFYLII